MATTLRKRPGNRVHRRSKPDPGETLRSKARRGAFVTPGRDMTRIAVIGAGVTGLTTAYSLLDRGFEVTVFDRHRATRRWRRASPTAASFRPRTPRPGPSGHRAEGPEVDAPGRRALARQPGPDAAQDALDGRVPCRTSRATRQTPSRPSASPSPPPQRPSRWRRAGASTSTSSAAASCTSTRTRRTLAHARMVNGLFAQGGLDRRELSPEEIRAVEPCAPRRLRRRLPDRERQLGRHPQVHHRPARACALPRADLPASAPRSRTSPRSTAGAHRRLRASEAFAGVVVAAGVKSCGIACALGDRVNIYPVKGYRSPSTRRRGAPVRRASSLLDDRSKIVASRFWRRPLPHRRHRRVQRRQQVTSAPTASSRSSSGARSTFPPSRPSTPPPGRPPPDDPSMLPASAAAGTRRLLQHRPRPPRLDALRRDGADRREHVAAEFASGNLGGAAVRRGLSRPAAAGGPAHLRQATSSARAASAIRSGPSSSRRGAVRRTEGGRSLSEPTGRQRRLRRSAVLVELSMTAELGSIASRGNLRRCCLRASEKAADGLRSPHRPPFILGLLAWQAFGKTRRSEGRRTMLDDLLRSFVLAALPVAALAQDATLPPCENCSDTMTISSWEGPTSRCRSTPMPRPMKKATGVKLIWDESSAEAVAKLRAQNEAGNVTWDPSICSPPMASGSATRDCRPGAVRRMVSPRRRTARPRARISASTSCRSATSRRTSTRRPSATDRCRRLERRRSDQRLRYFRPREVPGQARAGEAADQQPRVGADLLGVAPDQVYATLETDEGVQKALDKLARRSRTRRWWSAGAETPQLLADKEVVIGSTYNGRLFSVIEEQKQPVAMLWDYEVLDIDGFVVPDGAAGGPAEPGEALPALRHRHPAARGSGAVHLLRPGARVVAAARRQARDARHRDGAAHADEPGERQDGLPLPIRQTRWADHRDELDARFQSWLGQ